MIAWAAFLLAVADTLLWVGLALGLNMLRHKLEPMLPLLTMLAPPPPPPSSGPGNGHPVVFDQDDAA